ncbi:ferredoxin [Gordonia sp. HY285]|uniref:Ferredoxin n=1 Tax=Gordonia liuliyuniae TaxID=2911517 RepID=A0ABS9ITQ5_9ACTN|nr:ferredoxin [Gordonia liuliyuniae]MCF8588933.1 ferredoxin [Gordonia liuliyuniae]MCF8609186.1 ferredoxin [Gordonia liuliyuniae]
MIISIAGEKCTGHGRCYSVADRLLTDDDDGFVVERGTSWEVADGLHDEAAAAAKACPEGAISIRDA